MERIVKENVTIYKDFSMKNPYNTFLGDYDVEFVGEKARVIQNSVFSSRRQKSRLKKLSLIGRTSNDYMYELTVNGKKAFFTVNHNIYAT